MVRVRLISGIGIMAAAITAFQSDAGKNQQKSEFSNAGKLKSLSETASKGAEGTLTAPGTSVQSLPFYWAWWGWEPLEHNIRLGGPSYTVDASAWWAEKWYDRLHSEELVKKMSGAGINLAVTHFFKGFGLEFEKKQQENTARLVHLAHQHGIKVLGYCQFNSIYYETFFNEVPEATGWVQRDPSGNPVTWQGKYYRLTPCINCEEFRTYIKKVVRTGLEETGLDGFNFDNCFSVPCYCSRCEKLFREWLTKRYPEPVSLFGIGSFESVRQPPLPSVVGLINDPLTRTWIRWRCERLSDFVREITGYARSLDPGAILLANPAHPCNAGEPLLRSVWPVWVGKYLDLMIAENGNSPEIEDDLMVSQVRAHKHGAAVGYRAVPTTWAEGPKVNLNDASTRLPQTPDEIRLQIAEAAANGGIPGSNWATRALGGGNGMRIDIPELHDALASYLTFVRDNEDLIRKAQPVSDIAVLYTFASLAFNPRHAWEQVSATEEILIRRGFPWEVVFDDDLSRLEKFPVLLLSGQTHISDKSCAAIKNFASKGGTVIIIGENGVYDDEGRKPAENRLASLPENRVIHLKAAEIQKAGDRNWGVFIRLPGNAKEVAEKVEKAASDRVSSRLHGSDEVTLNAYRDEKGRMILHLVNYNSTKPAGNLKLEIGKAWIKSSHVRMLTPGAAEKNLAIRKDGNSGVIDLPELDVYGILIVE